MSTLETSMNSLVDVFFHYSSKDDDKFHLSRGELRDLLRGQLSSFLKASRDPRAVDRIMCELDRDRNGKVTFEEFVQKVTELTVASVTFFEGYVFCPAAP